MENMPPATLDVNNLISLGEAGESGAVTSEAASILRKWVDHAYEVTNKRLLQILKEKYKFEGHCSSIRKYLLMGQGDFMQCLMDHLSNELSNPAS
jgi:gamma-tubulin complex component 3